MTKLEELREIIETNRLAIINWVKTGKWEKAPSLAQAILDWHEDQLDLAIAEERLK